MALQIHNTLTHKKEEFKPQSVTEVKMYVCGPTVYDLSHIGHGRSYVIFDVIRRYLEYKGFKVHHIQNFTDVEDKITKRAAKLGVDAKDLTQQYVEEFFKDFDRLKVKRAERYVKVTDHIADIIAVIQKLVEKGCAYTSNGEVYFDTTRCYPYGSLLGGPVEDFMVLEDVPVSPKKRSALDFALWKKSKVGEPIWDSPWGKGRPGWHIECSAMSLKYLGPTLDIHGGGMDLIFPHHESEIMQSEGYTGKPFANYWLHNGFVTTKGRKMSKSSGEFTAVRELLEKFDADTLRFFLLNSHYRDRLEYSLEAVRRAGKTLSEIKDTIRVIKEGIATSEGQQPLQPATTIHATSEALSDATREVERAGHMFEEAMDDDFHIDVAVERLVEYSRVITRCLQKEDPPVELLRKALGVYAKVDSILAVLGLENS